MLSYRARCCCRCRCTRHACLTQHQGSQEEANKEENETTRNSSDDRTDLSSAQFARFWYMWLAWGIDLWADLIASFAVGVTVGSGEYVSRLPVLFFNSLLSSSTRLCVCVCVFNIQSLVANRILSISSSSSAAAYMGAISNLCPRSRPIDCNWIYDKQAPTFHIRAFVIALIILIQANAMSRGCRHLPIRSIDPRTH